MKLRLLLIEQWFRENFAAILVAPLLLVAVVVISTLGFFKSVELVEGKLIRYGVSPSSYETGQFAWVDLPDGRSSYAAFEKAESYLPPGSRVILSRKSDIWGVEWYRIDHNATEKLKQNP